MLQINKYNEVYNNWLKSFKSKLNIKNINETLKLYLLNKEIFEFPQKKKS